MVNFFTSLFIKNKEDNSNKVSDEEQMVKIQFDYGNTDSTSFYEVEELIQQRISESKVGEYDGNELAIDGSDGTMYLYGSDADQIYDTIKDILLPTKALHNIEITLGYSSTDRKTFKLA